MSRNPLRWVSLVMGDRALVAIFCRRVGRRAYTPGAYSCERLLMVLNCLSHDRVGYITLGTVGLQRFTGATWYRGVTS